MKTISVAMSTFNGAKYLEQQIESIINQYNVNTLIHIRDDGSSDNTVSVIKSQIEKYPGRITLEEGNNLGYQRSFIKALSNCEDADYYAFSDQDDIWLSDKCDRAVKCIEGLGNEALYASSLTLVDENLNVIGQNNIGNMSNNIECYFARPRLAGCTFLFSKSIRATTLQLSKKSYEVIPDHDFIVGACAYATGKVVLDKQSKIQHRRLVNSVTGGNNGVVKRLKVESNVIFGKNKACRDMARNIVKYCTTNEEVREFLITMAEYDKSIIKKIKLLKRPGFRTNIIVCDAEMAVKVLLGKM